MTAQIRTAPYPGTYDGITIKGLAQLIVAMAALGHDDDTVVTFNETPDGQVGLQMVEVPLSRELEEAQRERMIEALTRVIASHFCPYVAGVRAISRRAALEAVEAGWCSPED